MSSDVGIQKAVRDVLLPLKRGDNTFIARQTTVAAGHSVAPSAATVTLTDPTGFALGGLIRYDDTTGEPSAYLQEIAGAVATPNKTATFAHAEGTTVYTNLFHFAPWDIAPMLNAGDPVLFVHVTNYPTKQFTSPRGMNATFRAHIQYHRLLNRPDDTTNPNDWAEHQEITGRQDLAIINDALLANRSLVTENALAEAIQMSELNTQGALTTVDWGRVNVEGDTWHFIGTIEAVYAGKPYNPT